MLEKVYPLKTFDENKYQRICLKTTSTTPPLNNPSKLCEKLNVCSLSRVDSLNLTITICLDLDFEAAQIH